MKLLIQRLFTFAALVACTVTAFAPATPCCRSPRAVVVTPTAPTTVVLSMGLFDGIMDYFSEEAKAKRAEEKERMIEEQEEAFREVLERRRR